MINAPPDHNAPAIAC